MLMRGHDPETGQFFSASRSQQRREALHILALAEKLITLPAAKWARLPLNEQLYAQLQASQRITAHGARKRQVAFIAKQLRQLEPDVLHIIDQTVHNTAELTRQQKAVLHQIEYWRQRLLDDGDSALTELLGHYPHADRQQLRTLIRNARAEKANNQSPRAFRELFQVLRLLMADNTLPPETETSN